MAVFRAAAGWPGIAMLAVVFGTAGLLSGAISNAATSSFDHFQTGFPLEGAHKVVLCETCHLNAVFKGTPRQCGQCHNGLLAPGKPANHIQSTENCGDCHAMTIWTAVRFDHAAVTSACGTCHNGTTAQGKNPQHIMSSNACDDCHVPVSWSIVRVDHSSLTGSCSSCHNGVAATGKPPSHIVTSGECDACHSTLAWVPAAFDHDTVTGSCSSCHNGVTATGKSSAHFVTSLDCADCHTTTAWIPDMFRHASPAYPDHGARVNCTGCHTSNSETVTWPSAAYMPDCAGCHATDFKPDPHKKTESPTTLYTVSELRDCTGSCHIYTDSTLTTIKNSRSGEHGANRGDW